MFSITALNNKHQNRPALLKDQRGITTVEYVVILVLVAIGGITIWRTFSGSIGAKMTNVGATISTLQ
jgi:Flp pilus assembly pilin Flp